MNKNLIATTLVIAGIILIVTPIFLWNHWVGSGVLGIICLIAGGIIGDA